MSEIIPTFGADHQFQIVKTCRVIGRFLLDGLIEAGKCVALNAPDVETPVTNPITYAEIHNFARRSRTSEFDCELEVLIRNNPLD